MKDNIVCMEVVKLVACLQLFTCGELEAILPFSDVDVKKRDISSFFNVSRRQESTINDHGRYIKNGGYNSNTKQQLQSCSSKSKIGQHITSTGINLC